MRMPNESFDKHPTFATPNASLGFVHVIKTYRITLFRYSIRQDILCKDVNVSNSFLGDR